MLRSYHASLTHAVAAQRAAESSSASRDPSQPDARMSTRAGRRAPAGGRRRAKTRSTTWPEAAAAATKSCTRCHGMPMQCARAQSTPRRVVSLTGPPSRASNTEPSAAGRNPPRKDRRAAVREEGTQAKKYPPSESTTHARGELQHVEEKYAGRAPAPCGARRSRKKSSSHHHFGGDKSPHSEPPRCCKGCVPRPGSCRAVQGRHVPAWPP